MNREYADGKFLSNTHSQSQLVRQLVVGSQKPPLQTNSPKRHKTPRTYINKRTNRARQAMRERWNWPYNRSICAPTRMGGRLFALTLAIHHLLRRKMAREWHAFQFVRCHHLRPDQRSCLGTRTPRRASMHLPAARKGPFANTPVYLFI